jgi:NADH-quinone oxidoreductase subunit J
MNFALILFYGFGFVLLASALGVVLVRNPVHAALLLVLSFVTASGLWLLLYAEFLAMTLVLVYVGAVMVLFLFVVMMLDINLDKLREGFWGNLPLAALVGFLMAGEMAALLWRSFGAAETSGVAVAAPGYSNTKALGRVIYTDYVFAFELAAVILLVAIVAAIAITLRHRKATKYQDPATQLAARASERLRMVKMPSEPYGAPSPQPSPKGEGANVGSGFAKGGTQ